MYLWEAAGPICKPSKEHPLGSYTVRGGFSPLCAVQGNRPTRAPRKLPVGIPGTPSVDAPAALSPARCGWREHLDRRHHTIAEFPPEHFQEAGTEKPELRCPGRGITADVERGVGKALRGAMRGNFRSHQGVPFRHHGAHSYRRSPTPFGHEPPDDFPQAKGVPACAVELAESTGITDAFPFRSGTGTGRSTPDFATCSGRFAHPVQGRLGSVNLVRVPARLASAGAILLHQCLRAQPSRAAQPVRREYRRRRRLSPAPVRRRPLLQPVYACAGRQVRRTRRQE